MYHLAKWGDSNIYIPKTGRLTDTVSKEEEQERSEQSKILSQAIYKNDSLQILLVLKLGLKHVVPSCQHRIALRCRGHRAGQGSGAASAQPAGAPVVGAESRRRGWGISTKSPGSQAAWYEPQIWNLALISLSQHLAGVPRKEKFHGPSLSFSWESRASSP